MLATVVRLPAFSLPKTLEDELSLTQKEIYKKTKKQNVELSTMIKRYQANEHITVLKKSKLLERI